MNAIHFLHVLVAVIFLLCMKTSSSESESLFKYGKMMIRCIVEEREALLLFKKGVANKHDYLQSWKKEEEDCCRWEGVGCDNRTGHVTQLHLSSLLSSISSYDSSTSFSIGSSLLDLPYLYYLDLSGNNLTEIPEFIGSLTKLVHLDLSLTRIGGSIPYQIGNLSNLQYLNISFSDINSSIPKSIGSLNSLTYLDLSSNQLYGVIPHELGNLSNLQYLNLHFIYINSSIPKSIGSLKSLTYLDLSFNLLYGVIPQELGNLSKLHHLYLGYNSDLTAGNFEWLFSLSSLTYIDLRSIKINAPLSIIWSSLNQGVPSLSVINLSYCNLTGSIPESFGNMTSLTHLDLSGNQLNGVLPQFIFNLSNLEFIDFNDNNFTGPLPEFTHLSALLQYLDLSNNHLSGSLPAFTGLSSLEKLYLYNNSFSGSIPHSFGNITALTYLDLSSNQLYGTLPESFGNMTSLTELDLSENQLNGVLPQFIFNLSNLEFMDFRSNNFTGSLPDFTQHLSAALLHLYLSNNHLSGSLPAFTGFSSLESLYLDNNSISGSIPDFTGCSSLTFLHLDNNQLTEWKTQSIGLLSRLTELDVSMNSIHGTISTDFTGCSSLEVLALDNNAFSGSIPDFTGCLSLIELRLNDNQLTEWKTQSIELLSSLYFLDVSMNFIHSTISEAHLSNLPSLGYLNTSFNPLKFELNPHWLPPFQLSTLSLASCKLGPKFPSWIRNQSELEILDISNTQISDTIPLWFWNISVEMRLLNLSSNKIRGKFSPKYSGDIQEIDLSSNYFDGPLPAIPSKSLKINLSQNKFSGTLFSLSVGEDVFLSFLDISHNQLFGAIPDYWMHFQGLVFLNLGYNNLTGTIPKSIGHLVHLQTLIMRNNKLYGELPIALRNCTSLGFVDFGLNKLSGKVPSWIGEDLPNLYALILKSNSFYERMPREMCHLSNLHFLDLSMNKISGTIPPCFGSLTAMIHKGTEVTEHIYSTGLSIPQDVASAPGASLPQNSSYYDNAVARWKGHEFEYGRNFAFLKMIDLSTNELTGEIPTEITRLVDLKGLNLSGNRFYGNVPSEIGRLKELECLDLSTNQFSGKIPASMTGLYFLSYLDLSSNNFTGRIPSGTQLQGFNISTYEGNTGLCGKPLTNICPEDEPADQVWPSSREDGNGDDNTEYDRWFYVSLVVGFSTTFWGIIGTLLLNRRWRHAYFLFLDNLKERLFVVMAVRIARLKRHI